MGIDFTSISEGQKNEQWERFVKIALLLLFVALIDAIILLSWVPPVSRDALTHHLAVPKLYLEHGGIYEIPSIIFSYYPLNLDLLYIIPLYFGNDIVPKFIHFMFALLTAWLIYAYLVKRLGAIWALFGAIFFLSLPIIVKLSITVYVDLGLVFFSAAALISLLKWIENRFQVKFLILSAICCGLALGTKYNGLIALFILTVFIPFVYINNSKKKCHAEDSADKAILIKIQLKAVGFGAIFFLIALLVFSPWMIRNYVWKANPIYPLYDQIFNHPKPISPDPQTDHQILESVVDPQQTSKAKPTHWGSFAIRKVIYGESWWEIALIPARIFFQGQDDSPKRFDGKLSPFLLLLSFFAFFQINSNSAALRTERKIFIFFTVFFVLYAFFMTSIRIRYIAPIIPPLVILSIFGFHNIASAFTNRWKNLPNWFSKGCILFLGGALLSYNGIYIFQQFNYIQPFSYLSGQMGRDEYILKYRPEYSIYQYANRNLPDNSKILGLFLGNRRYYSDQELIFGVNEFKESVNRSDSADILLKELKKNGYTHVIIRFDLFNRWTSKQFGERKKEMLKEFFRVYIQPILSKDGYGLFELRQI
jgi:4-amino-4-deoxy-L-arabinose transferase-like glycosyltransferase